MCCNVMAHNLDQHDNPISCRSHNPILDKCLNDEAFPDGDISPPIASVIKQAMNAQCNMDVNVYKLLECFVDIQKDLPAAGLDKQKAIHHG